MIRDTISTSSARRFYDRLGDRHSWAEIYEGRAKGRALELLDLTPGLSVLNAGVGTGVDHKRVVAAVRPSGLAVGVDVSTVMLSLARRRAGGPVVQADVRGLPFRSSSFDRLLSAYVLDLLAADDLPRVLGEFRRVLKPGGLMVLVSLTDGISPSSRALIAAYTAVYRRRPLWLGGCRPLQLSALIRGTDLHPVHHETLVQMAVPSEIVAAAAPAAGA